METKIGICSRKQAEYLMMAPATAGGFVAVDGVRAAHLQDALGTGEWSGYSPSYLVYPAHFAGDNARTITADAAIAALEKDVACWAHDPEQQAVFAGVIAMIRRVEGNKNEQ